MSRVSRLTILVLAGLLAATSSAWGQTQYIGFVYPAGGQQGTTFQVKLGGLRLTDVNGVTVSGEGVTGEVFDYYRSLSPQDITLIREQLTLLKKGTSVVDPAMAFQMATTAVPSDSGSAGSSDMMGMMDDSSMMTSAKAPEKSTMAALTAPNKDAAKKKLMERLESRMTSWCNRPSCTSLAELVYVRLSIAPDAEPGAREIRLVTPRGVSNPMVFYVGQDPEVTRKPMKTADFQVLGKEDLAQRKRPPEEEEVSITVPCTMNGQIASGELNRYRFAAHKGQRLVITVKARELVPYIADAVPGWFQPVVTLADASGKEVAFNDDFRFKPDPTLLYEVAADGEYVLSITDAIYRGREDFVYRITVGEQPFVTNIFPLGTRAGAQANIEMNGWNLDKATLTPPPKEAEPGIHLVTAKKGDAISNTRPFMLDTLPECLDKESNDDQSQAQEVKLPIVVNGRVDRPDDWDVFKVTGRAGQILVAEVHARRLDSPVDSILKITDAAGKLLAFNDDHMDPGSGLNTHHADSYLMVTLPADGDYFVHLGDTSRAGGEEYAYRLRISQPRPDFELRVAPPTITIRGKSAAAVTVYALPKDGFAGTIKLTCKDLPDGLTAAPINLSAAQPRTRLTVKSNLVEMEEPFTLSIEGTAKIGDKDVVHKAVPAEDRMQAFLWRHLVPAQNLMAMVYNPSYTPPVNRVCPPAPEKPKPPTDPKAKPMFTERQVASRLKQLDRLYQEWLLTDDFMHAKVAECETGQ